MSAPIGLIGLACTGRAAVNLYHYLRGVAMPDAITTDPDYVDLANRFREGLKLDLTELENLRDHAQVNRNYLLHQQVCDAILKEIADSTLLGIQPANPREREAYRVAEPLDTGEDQ